MQDDNIENINQQELIKEIIKSIKLERDNFLNYVEQEIQRKESFKKKLKTWGLIPYGFISMFLYMWTAHYFTNAPAIHYVPLFIMYLFSCYGILTLMYEIIEILN